MHRGIQAVFVKESLRLLASGLASGACKPNSKFLSYIVDISKRWVATTSTTSADPFGVIPLQHADINIYVLVELLPPSHTLAYWATGRCPAAGAPPAQQARRVVVTGLGVVSPLGIGVPDVWPAVLRGDTGTKALRPDDLPAVRVLTAMRSHWIGLHMAGSSPHFSARTSR